MLGQAMLWVVYLLQFPAGGLVFKWFLFLSVFFYPKKMFGPNLYQAKSGVISFWVGGWVVLGKNIQSKFV